MSQLETIRQHFGDAVTIEEISNREIDSDASWVHDVEWDIDCDEEADPHWVEEFKQATLEEWEETYAWAGDTIRTIEEYCRRAVAAKANLPYLGRKTCGMLMRDAMLMMRADGKPDPPPGWYKVTKQLLTHPPDFAAGSESIYVMAARYAGIDFKPEDNSALFDYRPPRSYAEAWWRMAHWNLCTSPTLTALRDWLFEHDASEGKPPKPPWVSNSE